MKYPIKSLAAQLTLVALLITALGPPSAPAQTEAGSKGGYGKVYEAAGKTPAARSVQANMNLTLQRALARAKKKPPAESSARSRGIIVQRNKSPLPSPATTAHAKSSTYFKPDATANTASFLAESLGTNAQEKVVLKQLFAATKTAFETEVRKKGRQNNIAAALTLFIATTATVYHDVPEPSDEATDTLWDALNVTLDETPDIAKLTDREKQELYDTLIAFSGLLLATYLEGKGSNNSETLQTAKSLAGSLVQLVLKTDPEKLRFNKDGLVLG